MDITTTIKLEPDGSFTAEFEGAHTHLEDACAVIDFMRDHADTDHLIVFEDPSDERPPEMRSQARDTYPWIHPE